MPDLIRTLIWHRVAPPSAEYFGLWADGAGWQLRGTVIAPMDNVPRRVRYGVICDAAWRTRAVHIALRTGAEEQALHLTADGEGNWERSGEPLPELRGCLDIDLEITPATNTLPIRRLALAPGIRGTATAAWVRFPQLSIEPLRQTYRRTGAMSYHYRSSPDFSATIRVDDLGLVTRYADVWQCAASQDVSAPD
jgi:hypothetical protein